MDAETAVFDAKNDELAFATDKLLAKTDALHPNTAMFDAAVAITSACEPVDAAEIAKLLANTDALLENDPCGIVVLYNNVNANDALLDAVSA